MYIYVMYIKKLILEDKIIKLQLYTLKIEYKNLRKNKTI